MATIWILNETEVQRLLDLDLLLDALATGFAALSAEQIIAPKRSELTVPETGFLLTMPSYLSGKLISVKLVTVFPGNDQRQLPSHQALLCLFDAASGTPLALLGGTTLTALRTAGAAALATRLLARTEARVLAIVGAGAQGRAHLEVLPRVRPFTEIRITSKTFAHAERLAALDSRARAVASVEEALRCADVVCLCTSAEQPVLQREWLAPGTHLTSVGYHSSGGELPHAVIEGGHLFVETRLAFEPPPAGCSELQGFPPEQGTELGEVVLGQRPGRQAAEELTVYKAMGHAMEDLVAANLLYERALEAGLGQQVELS